MFGRIQFLRSTPPHPPPKKNTQKNTTPKKKKTYPPTFPFNSGESGGIGCSEDWARMQS